MEPVPITVVEVAGLAPDIGVEIDDGDDNPDTRTFVVPVASSGVITVTAIPNPPLPEASLPASWSLTGGTGTGKLQRTVNRTQESELTCTCGTSSKTLKIIPFTVEVFAETTAGVVNDGSMNSLTECMEGRNITYTSKLSSSVLDGIPKTFTFYFRRASGILWSASVNATTNSANYTAQADLVADSLTADTHKFSTPVYCSVSFGGLTAVSRTINIDVYELWIKHFKDANTGKAWKVCVGDNISYEAIASTDCTSWKWDMEEGVPDVWNPTGGDSQSGSGMKIPYSDLQHASNSYFGDRYGEVNVSCHDAEDNHHQRYSTDMRTKSSKAKVFFKPDLNIDGEIPSNANNYPEFDKRKRLIRPEERGEDYTVFASEQLLDKLRSGDRIEQRKAANALWTRYGSKADSLDDGEKSMISDRTRAYLSGIKADFEENTMQIQRLWHLAAPALLANVAHEDVSISENAASLLSVMKTPQIIESLVAASNEAETAADIDKYIFALEYMKINNRYFVDNRTRMSDSECEKYYKEHVKPQITLLKQRRQDAKHSSVQKDR